MRSNYWSCSSFADWLRGTSKLFAGTSEEWRDWKLNAKKQYPFRFWLAEQGLDQLQNIVMFIPDKLYAAKYYVNNRWVTGTHKLTAHPRDIQPGSWCDVGNRFLPCLFNELVDFVEVEQAWYNIAWDPEAREKYHAPFYARGWFRWRTWRSRESGLDALRWAAGLVYDEDSGVNPSHPDYGQPTPQAKNAVECINLYLWWTQMRPARPDPYEVSGWSDFCQDRVKNSENGIFGVWESNDAAAQHRRTDMINQVQALEQRYEQEDEDMMIRLIKLRQFLWT
jgi:hypothetical protein